MSLWLATLVIVGGSAAAIGVLFLVRRRAPHGGYFVEVGRASGVFGVLGTAFAVILGFVILLALQSYGNGKQKAGQEAVAVTQLHRTTAFLSDPTGAQLRDQLACYGRAVISDEWRTMNNGDESRLVEGWLDTMAATVASLSPREGRESIAYGHWFDQDAERREGRRGRLAEAQPFVPPLLWLVLALGAALVVGYVLVFADPRERFAVQALMTGAVTAMVISGLLIVGFLDTPFDDRSGSIRPTEMERTLQLIERGQPSVASRQLACDAGGRPT